jgi:hypothetical protein
MSLLTPSASKTRIEKRIALVGAEGPLQGVSLELGGAKGIDRIQEAAIQD